MVLNQDVDIHWMLGMIFNPDNNHVTPFEIVQAMQQTILKMNEKGAQVKSATAISMVLSAPPGSDLPDYIINKPFLIWITRDSLNKPLFIGYIDRDAWKNPDRL